MQPFLSIDLKYLNLLGSEETALLFSKATFQKVKKGETIIPSGKPVRDVFYIHKGIVRLYMTNEAGKEINTHLAWEGMFITSLFSLINNIPSEESVMAITDCELLHFPYDFISGLYDAYPKIERLSKVLVEEAFSCQFERVRLMQTLTAKSRYHRLMESMPTEVFLAIPMQDIASYLGIAPGSLSRIRNEFLHNC